MLGFIPINFVNDLNIGVIIIDEDKKIVYWNKWVTNKLHVDSPKQIEEEIIIDELLEEPQPRLMAAISEALKIGNSSILSNSMNKSHFPFYYGTTKLSYNLVVSRIVITDKHFVSLQFIDTTLVSEREKYLSQKQRELDEERERSFFQDRLASFGSMTSNIAHEINNPLAIIQTSILLVKKLLAKEGNLSEKVESQLESAKTGITRISDIITSIRMVADSGEIDHFEELTLKKLFESIFPIIEFDLNKEEIQIELGMDSPEFYLEFVGVRGRLYQVFLNLFNNSIYAFKGREGAEKPSKKIQVQASVKGRTLEIVYTDNAGGIPKDIQEKIFLPFFTTKDVGEGIGMGLSTSISTLQELGGDIKLDSSVEGHSTFIITIPLA